jgi:hypothetical protein
LSVSAPSNHNQFSLAFTTNIAESNFWYTQDIYYTTKPENVMKYATFMHDIGTLKNEPASIKELFFADIDVGAGN